MENILLHQGLDLMLFGMGTVFVFLTLLVIATILMSQIVQNYFAEAEVIAEPVKMASVGGGSQTVDAKTLKVIQEAIHQHRAKKG